MIDWLIDWSSWFNHSYRERNISDSVEKMYQQRSIHIRRIWSWYVHLTPIDHEQSIQTRTMLTHCRRHWFSLGTHKDKGSSTHNQSVGVRSDKPRHNGRQQVTDQAKWERRVFLIDSVQEVGRGQNVSDLELMRGGSRNAELSYNDGGLLTVNNTNIMSGMQQQAPNLCFSMGMG